MKNYGQIERGNIMASPRIGGMLSNINNKVKKLIIPFGRVASGNSTKLNIQNAVGSEVREVKVISPYGISSCPPSGLFAQMIINDNVNNTCVGVHNPQAPQANAGEIILYSVGGAKIKLGIDGTIILEGSTDNGTKPYIQLANGSITIVGNRVNIVELEESENS